MSAKRAKKPNKPVTTVSPPLPDATPLFVAGNQAGNEAESWANSDENSSELQRLLLALDYADGFVIFFARCNVPAQRRQLIAELARQLTLLNLHLLELHFDQPVRDLRSHLHNLLASLPGQSLGQANLPNQLLPLPKM